MNNGLKSGLVLLVIGIICGTLLAVVNYATSPYIQAYEAEKKNVAFAAIVEDEDGNALYDLNTYILTTYDDVTESVSEINVYTDNGTIELIIYEVSSSGYNADVTMLIAVNKDFNVVGYQVISHSEDAGFGADIVDTDFEVDTITDINMLVFDSISGATFTKNAILNNFITISERAASDFGGGLDD